jgi:hypothetical protein
VVTAVPEHPNLPRRGPLGLMFAAISGFGMLGGLIGYGIVQASCADTPTHAERLLEQVRGFRAHAGSCDVPLLLAAVLGALVAAIGAAIVSILVMRAQSEWRGHAPTRARSGGTPRRT